MSEEKIEIIVCGVDPDGKELKPGQVTGGLAAIMIEESHDCKDCGREHELEKCPKCGSWIFIGYGLAYGGMGEYKECDSDSCDWWWKRQDQE